MADAVAPVNFEVEPDGTVVSRFWTELVYQTGPALAVPPFSQQDVAVSAITEATAQLVVDLVTNKGGTNPGFRFTGAPCMGEFQCASVLPAPAASQNLRLVLWDADAGVSLGWLFDGRYSSGAADQPGIHIAWRFQPPAGVHHYQIRGFVSAAATITVRNGDGGSGNRFPAFGRILTRTA